MASTPTPPGPVVIGMDPHKRSVTIEVMNAQEAVITGGRFTTDETGFAQMLAFTARFTDKVWAVEGCSGIGKHVALRLVAAGETVVDVPARLSHRVRLVTAGNGRKTDDTDAHSIAVVGVRSTGLRPVVNDAQLELLRVLLDRRRMLGEEHTRKIAQVHRLLLELVPGGAKRWLSAKQAREILTHVRPKDPAGKARKALAMELVKDLEQVYKRTVDADKQLTQALTETGTHLTDLHGIGPTGAATLLVEAGDISRFPNRDHFASWTGTAPIDASSGDHVRHRLSRKGNWQVNKILHTMAIVQIRHDTEGRAYYQRCRAAGKNPMEALRNLKRRLSDLVYRTMINDYASASTSGLVEHPDTVTHDLPTASTVTPGPSRMPLARTGPGHLTEPLRTAS